MRKFFATEPIEKAISILFLIAVALMLTCSIAHAQTVKQEATTASSKQLSIDIKTKTK